MIKKGYCLILSLILILILIYTYSLFLISTKQGTYLLTRWIKQNFSETISFSSASGKLSGRFELNELKVHTENFDVEIDHLVAVSSLNPLRLNIHNKSLILDNLHVNINPYLFKKGDNTRHKLRLPVHLKADNILLKQIVIAFHKKHSVELSSVKGALTLDPQQISLHFFQDPKNQYFQLKKTRNVIQIDLKTPLAKTTCLLHCCREPGKSSVQGSIIDSHDGQIVVMGSGSETFNTQVTAKEFHLNDLLKHDWPQVFNMDLQIKQQAEEAIFSLKSFSGNINHQPLAGYGQLTLKENKILTLFLKLTSLNSQIVVSGKQNPELKLDWLFKIPDLSLFLPKSCGQLSGTGHLDTNASKANFLGNFSVNDFHYADLTIDRGKGEFSIQTDDQAFSTLKFLASTISYQKFTLENTELCGSASLGRDSFSLTGRSNFHLNHSTTTDEDSSQFNLNQKIEQMTTGKLVATIGKAKTTNGHIALLLPKGEIESNFSLPNFSLKKVSSIKSQAIKGKLNLQCSDLAFLETLLPIIKNVTGVLKGEFNLEGSIFKPLLNGGLNLANGSFRLPKLKLKANNVELEARKEGKITTYQGKLTSGNGRLEIEGRSSTENANAFPLTLNLRGKNVLIYNTQEIKIIASPNLNLHYQDNKLRLVGDVLIPEANLLTHDFNSTENVSDDVVLVNNDGKPREKNNLQMISNITLTLGDHIFINSKGIKGQILGQIRIQDNPAQATVAYGQLKLHDGSYTIYGRTLQIDYGRLIFTGGPLSNPALALRASRTVQINNSASLFSRQEQLKVGASISGSLHTPKIDWFSEPSGKTSADILSYLLFGMPANNINGSNTSLLLEVADTLNANSTNKFLNIKNQVKKKLGLSDFGIGNQSEIDPITQESSQHTAIFIGKYLSPKFYVKYSMDLFDHSNTLKIRYLLNKFWTIQSVTNTNASGVDVLYTH